MNKESVGNMQVTIYPNPNTGQFILETSSQEKQVMNIYDVDGRLVLTQTIFEKTIIDMNGLDDGIYNLSLKSATGVAYKKLIIVK
jgi:hypothetical protein